MKQVVQNVRTGHTEVVDIPIPVIVREQVLVAVEASVISAGTERYITELTGKSLLGKARERPDHVKRVLQKVRTEGLASTLRQVREKLDDVMPLGYSAAGTVLDCGAAIRKFKPGDRVAVAAPHASVVAVGQNLCSLIPDGVPSDQASYAGIGAIALQGVRLAKVTLGESVLVIGLGLIGLIATGLLKAQGCRVFAIDLDASRADLAKRFGADTVASEFHSEAIDNFSRGLGVDAVIIATATTSNGPIEFAADSCRTKARIVLVGTAGLNIPRPPFFDKELNFIVSHSLGAGRGDPVYEDKGVDYPIGYARWTAQRNMDAVLDQIAARHLGVDRLTTHRFAVEDAAKAYDLLVNRTERYLGIVLEFPSPPKKPFNRTVQTAKPTTRP